MHRMLDACIEVFQPNPEYDINNAKCGRVGILLSVIILVAKYKVFQNRQRMDSV